MNFEVKAVGKVVSPIKEPMDENWGAVVSEIVLDEGYSEGLAGLDDFSHAIVIYFMHLATDKGRIKAKSDRGNYGTDHRNKGKCAQG